MLDSTRLTPEWNQSDGSYVLLGKTSRTILSVLLLALLPYLVPGLERYRILPALRTSATENAKEPVPQAAKTDLDVVQTDTVATPGEVEDLSGHALEKFFSALYETETTQSQTRVCHYGDSPITNDGITSTLRRKLQLRFGDAGHGFVLAARPWAWCQHAGVITRPRVRGTAIRCSFRRAITCSAWAERASRRAHQARRRALEPPKMVTWAVWCLPSMSIISLNPGAAISKSILMEYTTLESPPTASQ